MAKANLVKYEPSYVNAVLSPYDVSLIWNAVDSHHTYSLPLTTKDLPLLQRIVDNLTTINNLKTL